ncbi:3-deoxy-7-phosphoheptulonate synthase domain protein [Streptococcus oralis SK313]|uniref:3-deoxy-7-phosphoheptulonate synthase domain protein n=1 Tax=Streptococcus oralis SK313 TaxID=1035190 RepID=F9Q3Z3_STROR|nr:3-deoxy-7-phosphoheptulonate synthase domain protein [Streptococcus oralis SK313]
MAFIEKGQEIDIEAIKAATQLSAEALRKKKPVIESWQLSSQVRTTESFW